MRLRVVTTNKELLKFIKFQWEVYKNDPHWVPMLVSDLKLLFDNKKNLFWEHADKKLFYIEDENGKILSRVCGVIDYNFIKFHKERTGFFAFFECLDTKEAKNSLNILLSSVEMWLKEKGMKKILGPTAPSTNDEMGLLYEGYDSEPVLMMPYNPPYYHELLINYGFKKAKDLYAYKITKENLPIGRIKKIVDTVKTKLPQLKIRPVNMKNFAQEIKYAVEIYNDAWEKNWGFVPWTEKEFVSQALRLKPLIKPEFVLFSFLKEEPVGMIITVPNYNEVLKKLNGKLGPIEIIKFLYYKNRIKSLRIMVMGVKKEYRNRGIEVVMYYETILNALKEGYQCGEISWILEDNVMMNRAAETLGAVLYKKYRVYEKDID
ncbi:MAG: N-acetyltransferase [Endomicrobiia bacterium]